MHNLQSLTPLGGRTPRTDTVDGVTVSEEVGYALASVAARLGSEDQTRALVADLIGAVAPAPGRAAGDTLSAFWVGPDQWMVEAPIVSHEDLADQIKTRADGAASVTEQTDGWCRLDLKGDRLAGVFALLCGLDYPSFTGGEATRTSIDHLGCFVVCRSPGHASIIGPRSSAGSLHHAILTAIRASA